MEAPSMLARALGIYEPFKMRLVKQLVSSGSSFVDIGANKGDFTLLAARLVGPGGRVLSIEPSPENCEILAKSIRINKYNNITIRQLAISDSIGNADLHLGDGSGWHTLTPGILSSSNRGIISVKTSTLDDLLVSENMQTVDTVKIDVEGAEIMVLSGAKATLNSNPDICILLDIHPTYGVNIHHILELITAYGLRSYDIRTKEKIDCTNCEGVTELCICREETFRRRVIHCYRA